MSVQAGIGGQSNYFLQVLSLARMSATQLVRPPSHSRRAEAARRSARRGLLLAAILGAVIIALMVALDVAEIGLMPPRGTASLWPVRILTDFGKDIYVLAVLAVMLLVVGFVAAALRGTSQARLLSLGLRLQFLFFAVLVPLIPGEILKWIVGRGRPFVGGQANPYNFVTFNGTEAYASFPSAHAVTGFALAFARALGEYGSVVFISGNMPMRTEVVPLLIMTELEQFDYQAATAIALVMLLMSFGMLFLINLLQRWSAGRHAV